VLHALPLVKVKYGGSEYFLESLFEITFIDSDFSAKRFYRQGLADMLKQDFPCFDDLLAVCLIGQEFTLEGLNPFVANHAFQAIEKQHLGLRVNVDIFEAVGIIVIQ